MFLAVAGLLAMTRGLVAMAADQAVGTIAEPTANELSRGEDHMMMADLAERKREILLLT